MKYPNFHEEKKLWRQGLELVAGLDEAGRGPLAGPVVAAAVMLHFSDKKHSNILKNVGMFSGINDSKKLSAKKREYFYEKLTNHKNITFGVGVVSEKMIDKINILEATKLAMQKAVKNLGVRIDNEASVFHDREKRWRGVPDFLILDGNFKINSKIPQKPIVGGDDKVFSITAAGIIAKVTRDRMMKKFHLKYPSYGFDQHKGYGTKLHIKKLLALGPCKIHRKSFSPVKTLAKTEFV